MSLVPISLLHRVETMEKKLEKLDEILKYQTYIVNLILDIKDFHKMPLGRSREGERIVRGYLSDFA